MSKRILAALFSVMLVIGMMPFGAFAESTFEHTHTLPAAGASSSDKPLITIGTIADGHADYGIQDSEPYIRNSYIKAMNALKAEGVDIVLDGGDMVSGNQAGKGNRYWEKSTYDKVVAAYKKYATTTSTTGITLWACGNHEFEVGKNTDPANTPGADYNSYGGFMQVMLETAGQPKSLYTEKDDTPNSVNDLTKDNWLGVHYNIKGFDFIILNPPYARSDYYTKGTLNWLDETLATIGANKTVFIIGHYPLYDSKGPSTTQITSIRGENYTNFMNVMKKYNNAVYLFGHIHDQDNGYINSDTFERITHYDKNGKVVTFRSVQPTSFISSYVGSAGFYGYSYNPGGLSAADPYIVQANTIKVYADRIEFKTINCGEKEGTVREPQVYTVYRDVANGTSTSAPVEFKTVYTLPSDILTTANKTSGNFGLYYMNQLTGELSNNWDGSCGPTYINNKSSGHSYGTFALASGGGIKVFPAYKQTAVVMFTAPVTGEYVYEVPVSSIAITANGLGNKQVVFSVMKDGAIYNITEPTYNKNYSGTMSGRIRLNKGDKLLFTADWYVKFNGNITPADHTGHWSAGSFNSISLALLNDAVKPEATKKYSFDGTGFNFTADGYNVTSNTHFSLAAIDVSAKKTLAFEQGTTTIYSGATGTPIYKGTSGNVALACHYTNGNLMIGPWGPGNSNKNIASGVAFTAPADGTYNMTALLLHDWDYQTANAKKYAMIYEILDSDLNVIFQGNTANVYTDANIQHTYSRAAGTVFLKKGEKVYLSFRAAPEANVTNSDAITMRVMSLDVTQLSAGCVHEWDGKYTCTVCGITCKHEKYSGGVCTVCGKSCAHKWSNSKCTLCGKSCTHNWINSKCVTCGKTCSHTWKDNTCTTCGKVCTLHTYKDEKCTVCGMKEPKNPEGMVPPNLSGTTSPDNTTEPDTTPGDTTAPDTTDPDSTTDPTDTTVPDTSDPADNEQDKGGNKDNSVLIAVIIGAACVIAIALILIFGLPKKAKK